MWDWFAESWPRTLLGVLLILGFQVALFVVPALIGLALDLPPSA